MKTIEEQIDEINQQVTLRVAWIDRTTKTVWKLIAVLTALIIIANILNWFV